MGGGHCLGLALHDLEVHQDLAGPLFFAGKLVALQIHQAHVGRFHESFGNQGRGAKRDVLTHSDGQVSAVAIDIGALP